MKSAGWSLLACAAAMAAAQCFLGLDAQAAAQLTIRVKARLAGFDGQVMMLEPLAPQPAAKDDAAKPVASFAVSVLPDTRYVVSQTASFASIKPGDYAGAAVTEGRGERLRAKIVYLYDEALRGSGEGRFPEGERLMIHGTVSAAAAPDDKNDGALTLHYRGAVLTGLGRGRTLCEGRASPRAYASALACEGDVVITVPAATPVLALTVGDQSLLVPGALVTVTMIKTADDKNVTPGVIVEKPATVEKPQSPP